MCDGSTIVKGFKWRSLVEAANNNFNGVDQEPGVYCIKVLRAPRTDLGNMAEEYLEGQLMKAMEEVLRALRRDHSQEGVLDRMQTRQELYDLLGYDGKVAKPVNH